MRSRRVLALLCAVPLVLTGLGCSNRALRVSRISPPAGAEMSSYTARMMQLAERYEQQGNREGALRLYRQIAANDPGDSRAQSRITAITGQVPQPAQNETRTSLASTTRNNTLPTADIPVPATPEPDFAVQAPSRTVVTPQPVVPTPREMPVALNSRLRELPPADSDAPLAGWVPSNSERIATPAPESVSVRGDGSGSSRWWGDEPVRWDESSLLVDDATSREVNPTPVWTRTSLVRLCPDAGDELRLIVARLDSDEDAARKEVLMALSDLGEEAAAALPAVELLLDDSDDSIRAHAAWAIWRIGGSEQRSVATLAALTRSKSGEVAQVSAFFLGSIGADARNAIPLLREARDQSNGATRLHLAEALIRIDPQDLSSLNELTRALQDRDVEMRWLAAVALSGASSEQASRVIPALEARLSDSDADVCSAAALTLGSLGPAATSAVSSLEQATTHHALDVRVAAETALACIQR